MLNFVNISKTKILNNYINSVNITYLYSLYKVNIISILLTFRKIKK